MKRFIMLLIILVICVIGLGFYRSWFGITTEGSGSQRHITLTIDEDKIRADEKRARDQLPALGKSTTAPTTNSAEAPKE